MISFTELVKLDVRLPTAPGVGELRRPENLEAWYRELVDLKTSLGHQLSTQKEFQKALSQDVSLTPAERHQRTVEYAEWRKRALRKARAVEDRIIEVKQLRDRTLTEIHRDEVSVRRFQRAKMVYLAEAILRHRQASETSGLEPEPHDLELWDAIVRIKDEPFMLDFLDSHIKAKRDRRERAHE